MSQIETTEDAVRQQLTILSKSGSITRPHHGYYSRPPAATPPEKPGQVVVDRHADAPSFDDEYAIPLVEVSAGPGATGVEIHEVTHT